MGADRRQRVHVAVGVPVRGQLLAVQVDDPAVSRRQFVERAREAHRDAIDDEARGRERETRRRGRDADESLASDRDTTLSRPTSSGNVVCHTPGVATNAPTGIYRGVPADERRAERRERLLDAGLEILGTQGWQATTVRGICEHAKLNPRYFYESFSGLDELLVAVFDRISGEAMEAVVEAIARNPEDPEATARATIGAFVEVMTADPRKGRVAFVEAMGSEALMRRRLDTLQEAADVMAGYARGLDLDAVKRADKQTIELTAQVLAGGLVEALIAWFEGRLEVSRERLVEHCAALFVAAIGVRAP
jgi:AcrR family transcriptional regulator